MREDHGALRMQSTHCLGVIEMPVRVDEMFDRPECILARASVILAREVA